VANVCLLTEIDSKLTVATVHFETFTSLAAPEQLIHIGTGPLYCGWPAAYGGLSLFQVSRM